MARFLRLSAIVIFTAALAACASDSKHSDSSSSTTTTEKSFPASAVFKGNAALTGAIAARGPFKLDYHSASSKVRTCAEIAASKGPGANFSVPFPRNVGPKKVTVLTTVSPYKGPGQYGRADFTQLEVLTAANGKQAADTFVGKPSSVVRLEVKPDGGGSFTFTGLRDSSGKTLSGSTTWTCTTR